MRTYGISIIIKNIDNGPAEDSEVVLGRVQADSIEAVRQHASTLGKSFVDALAPQYDLVKDASGKVVDAVYQGDALPKSE